MLPFRTTQITVLLQSFDVNGVIRCPVNNKGYFGITIELEFQQALSKCVAQSLGNSLERPDLINQFEIITLVEPLFSIDGMQSTMLCLVRIAKESFQAPDSWPTFMSYLREVPQGKMRVAYNKALQYFAGAHLDSVDVLELDSVVREKLQSLHHEIGALKD